MTGKLHLISTGPGNVLQLTPAASMALKECDIIIGYSLYLDLVSDLIEGKEILTTPLTRERDRANAAVVAAREGKCVGLLSSGDIGVYAMATLAFELMTDSDDFDVVVHPGITAALAAASLLGAPMSHDFATLSLSDLLCNWQVIEKRASHIAQADLCVALYNVQSKTRQSGVYRILDLMLEHKPSDTLCGVVRNAYRENQQVYIRTLGELREEQFDMFTTIVIGNRLTTRKRSFIYTPRGYSAKSEAETAVATDNGACAQAQVSSHTLPNEAIWVFSGTSDGNELANAIASTNLPTVVSTATSYGARVALRSCRNLTTISGKIGRQTRRELLNTSKAKVIIDATHPFAENISRQLIELSEDLRLPYIRFERPEAFLSESCVICPDFESAGKQASLRGSRILLTTGSNNVRQIVQGSSESGNELTHEWFARITPSEDSLRALLEAGIPETNICAMQGPFSKDFNIALCKQWRIDCIVAKNSGAAGGLSEKIEAAQQLGIPIIVVQKPKVEYPLALDNWSELRIKLNELGVLTNG